MYIFKCILYAHYILDGSILKKIFKFYMVIFIFEILYEKREKAFGINEKLQKTIMYTSRT